MQDVLREAVELVRRNPWPVEKSEPVFYDDGTVQLGDLIMSRAKYEEIVASLTKDVTNE